MGDFPAQIDVGSLDGADGFRIAGFSAHSRAGTGLSSADINGDGLSDIMIGAPGDDRYRHGPGSTYVIFGSTAPSVFEFDVSSLDGNSGFVLVGGADDQTGRSLATGDFNGDGFHDLILAAPGAFDITDGNYDASGGAYIVYGGGDDFQAVIDLTSLSINEGRSIFTDSTSQDLGAAVASAGDVNGDGFDDVLTYGTYRSLPEYPNQLFLFFGNDDSNVTTKTNVYRTSRISMDGAGDINGDGFDDFLVNRTYVDFIYGYNRGPISVVFGSEEGPFHGGGLTGVNGFYVPSDSAGTAFSGLGDVNGDGFSDIMVANKVIFGKADGFAKDLDPATLNGSNGFRLFTHQAGPPLSPTPKSSPRCGSLQARPWP